MLEQQLSQTPAATTVATDELSQLLQKEFKPKTDQARSAVEAAVQTLAQQALSQTVHHASDAYATIQAIITEIDQKLTEQINTICITSSFSS